MADLKKTFAPKPKELNTPPLANTFLLGTMICKFTIPKQMINGINKAYDNAKDLPAHNHRLAGKIADEFKVTDILTEEMKDTFLNCFRKYLETIQKPFWHCFAENAWINEMKSGEYNPMHFHTSDMTDVGLSSVLMLKRPDWYGVEASLVEKPANGWLEFTGGDQSPLAIPQMRVDAQVGEFYVFPYSLMHGVYPFNSTDEVRRTMSYNCNLFKPGQLAKEE